MGEKEKKEKFWVNDPSILFTNLKPLPTSEMTRTEKLNAATRLAIIVTIVLYFMDIDYWLTFLLAALLIIVLFKFAEKEPKEGDKEHFTVSPTYASLDFQQTDVAPLFSEEWSVIPPAYDLVENIPPEIEYVEPINPQSYPYGQYLTTTNLLPNDEQAARMLNGGVRQARSYANSAFTRQTLAFRENMTRLYKKKLARRFKQQNTNDTFSPFTSF